MPPLINSVALNEYFMGLPVPRSEIPGGSKTANSINKTTNALSSIAPVSPLGKTIQKSYRFFVTFFPNYFLSNKSRMSDRIGTMPVIRAFHVQGISIPQYTFSKETQYYGSVPRSFPVLKHDGFEVKIDFEEDEKGTIGFFISWLQRLAIEPTHGYYTPPDLVKIPVIGVVTETDFGLPIAAYTLHDAFYLTASGSDFDYTTGTAVKYSITFNVDIINSFFPQASIFNKLTNAILG